MRTANLVVAIAYSVIIIGLFSLGFVSGDRGFIFASMVLSVPIIMNWLSWKN